MPIPVFRHHDAAQIGMAAEVNTEEVKNLALVKVRGWPDSSDAVKRGRIAVEANNQTHPLFAREGKYVIDDLKSRLRGVPVDSSNILKKVVAVLFHCFAGGDDAFASDSDGQFVAVELCVGSEISECFDRGIFGVRLEDGRFALDG